MYRCNAAVHSKLCMNPVLLSAVPNQSRSIRLDFRRMSTAIVLGAISVTTKDRVSIIENIKAAAERRDSSCGYADAFHDAP